MDLERSMQALKDWPEADVCGLLASWSRRARLEGRESQEVFASRAMLSLRTYKRFEADGKGTLETFIRVLRALGRTQYLIQLFAWPLPAKTPDKLEDKLRRINARVLLDRARDPDQTVVDITAQLVAALSKKEG